MFHDGQVQLSNDYTTITGQRYPSTGLYYIDLPEPPPVAPQSLHPFACSPYKMRTKSDLIQYLHRCAFSPVVHTWTKAIDAGFFATWPGLTSELVRKHLPKLLATAKGHLQQDWKKHTLNQTFSRHCPSCPPKSTCAPSPIPSSVC